MKNTDNKKKIHEANIRIFQDNLIYNIENFQKLKDRIFFEKNIKNVLGIYCKKNYLDCDGVNVLYDYLNHKEKIAYKIKQDIELSNIPLNYDAVFNRRKMLKHKIKEYIYTSKWAFPIRWLRALFRKLSRPYHSINNLNEQINGQQNHKYPFEFIAEAEPYLDRAEKRIGCSVISLSDNEKKDMLYSYWSETYGDDYEDKRLKQYETYLQYLPKGTVHPFADIGCGAGEFVAFLKKNGINAIGVDREIGEVDRAPRQGIKTINLDGLSFLKNFDEPLSGVSLIEVIEHQPVEDIFQIIEHSYRRIVSGGTILIESLNARHPYFIQGFYSDFTHVRPVTDAFLTFLMQWVGFKEIKLIFTVPAPVSFISPNDLLRIYWCYALIGKKP